MRILKQKNELITQLKRDILPLQRIRSFPADSNIRLGISNIEEAFPNTVFPIGCTHEFVCSSKTGQACTDGFIAGIAGTMMSLDGICLSIRTSRTLYPTFLKRYGAEPRQVISINVKKEEDMLYVAIINYQLP